MRHGIDRAVGILAAAQHGLATHAQLLGLGLTARMIESRLRRGFLHRVFPGVYAVGHPPTTAEARWLAAVFACGDGALLSHRSGAALWDIRGGGLGTIDVTSHSRRGYTYDRIALHRASTLTSADSATRRGVPVTTLERTLIDLGSVVHLEALEYAIHRAESRRILDLEALRNRAASMPANHRGAKRVRTIVGAPYHDLDAATRSPAERVFLRICRRFGVPTPDVNRWIPLPIASGGLEVDFCWPDQRVVVEVDEAGGHSTQRARRNDPARDRALTAAGWRPIRFPEEELKRRPRAVAADVLGALRATSSAP